MPNLKGLGKRNNTGQASAVHAVIGDGAGGPTKKSKNVEMDMPLYQRLRRMAFEEELPEVHIIRDALDEYLTAKGYS